MLARRTDTTTNADMVGELVNSGTLRNPACIAAFKAIDRRHFWVESAAELAYADMPLRSGRLHQSAPHIYARALESLMPLRPGMSFLNIGSGTGYFSSVVSELVGENAINDGIDIWAETVAHATDRCRRIGKHSIHFTQGNVYQLDVERGMRYDRIYVGACGNSKSKYLYRLLEVGGVLIGPFQARQSQQLRRVTRRTESKFVVEELNSVQFAPLVEPQPTLPLPEEVPPEHAAEVGGEIVRALGLPGVPFTFALREVPWAPDRSRIYPASFQVVASAVIHGKRLDNYLPCVPAEIWIKHILPCCSRTWFEVAVAPEVGKTPVSAALALASRAAKRVFSLRHCRSGSVSSDGGSTRASSSQSSRMNSFSTEAEEPRENQNHAQMLAFGGVLYEALSNGQQHVIGARGDPDDFNHEAMLTALLHERWEETGHWENGNGTRARAMPRRRTLMGRVWRLAGWCFSTGVARGARRGYRATIGRCCRFIARNTVNAMHWVTAERGGNDQR